MTDAHDQSRIDAVVKAIKAAFTDQSGDGIAMDRDDPDDLRVIAQVAVRTARADALEEAAKQCDRLAGDPKMYGAERRKAAGQCAAAIRAMKDEP